MGLAPDTAAGAAAGLQFKGDKHELVQRVQALENRMRSLREEFEDLSPVRAKYDASSPSPKQQPGRSESPRGRAQPQLVNQPTSGVSRSNTPSSVVSSRATTPRGARHTRVPASTTSRSTSATGRRGGGGGGRRGGDNVLNRLYYNDPAVKHTAERTPKDQDNAAYTILSVSPARSRGSSTGRGRSRGKGGPGQERSGRSSSKGIRPFCSATAKNGAIPEVVDTPATRGRSPGLRSPKWGQHSRQHLLPSPAQSAGGAGTAAGASSAGTTPADAAPGAADGNRISTWLNQFADSRDPSPQRSPPTCYPKAPPSTTAVSASSPARSQGSRGQASVVVTQGPIAVTLHGGSPVGGTNRAADKGPPPQDTRCYYTPHGRAIHIPFQLEPHSDDGGWGDEDDDATAGSPARGRRGYSPAKHAHVDGGGSGSGSVSGGRGTPAAHTAEREHSVDHDRDRRRGGRKTSAYTLGVAGAGAGDRTASSEACADSKRSARGDRRSAADDAVRDSKGAGSNADRRPGGNVDNQATSAAAAATSSPAPTPEPKLEQHRLERKRSGQRVRGSSASAARQLEYEDSTQTHAHTRAETDARDAGRTASSGQRSPSRGSVGDNVEVIERGREEASVDDNTDAKQQQGAAPGASTSRSAPKFGAVRERDVPRSLELADDSDSDTIGGGDAPVDADAYTTPSRATEKGGRRSQSRSAGGGAAETPPTTLTDLDSPLVKYSFVRSPRGSSPRGASPKRSASNTMSVWESVQGRPSSPVKMRGGSGALQGRGVATVTSTSATAAAGDGAPRDASEPAPAARTRSKDRPRLMVRTDSTASVGSASASSGLPPKPKPAGAMGAQTAAPAVVDPQGRRASSPRQLYNYHKGMSGEPKPQASPAKAPPSLHCKSSTRSLVRADSGGSAPSVHSGGGGGASKPPTPLAASYPKSPPGSVAARRQRSQREGLLARANASGKNITDDGGGGNIRSSVPSPLAVDGGIASPPASPPTPSAQKAPPSLWRSRSSHRSVTRLSSAVKAPPRAASSPVSPGRRGSRSFKQPPTPTGRQREKEKEKENATDNESSMIRRPSVVPPVIPRVDSYVYGAPTSTDNSEAGGGSQGSSSPRSTASKGPLPGPPRVARTSSGQSSGSPRPVTAPPRA